MKINNSDINFLKLFNIVYYIFNIIKKEIKIIKSLY